MKRTKRTNVVRTVVTIGLAATLCACGTNDPADTTAAAPVPTDDPAGVVDPETGRLADGETAGPDLMAGTGTTSTDAASTGEDVDEVAPATADPLAVAAAGPVSAVGVIVLNRAATLAGGTTTLAASFAELPAPREVDGVLADFLPAPDTCTVERGRIDGLVEENGAGPGLDPFGTAQEGDPARSIGAGDALVFTSPEGTWATLPRRELDGFVAYVSDGTDLPARAPTGLVVDIPGDEFPGFVAVPVPVVPPLTGLSPGPLEPVTSATVFRWDVIEEPREVAIDVLGIDPETLETVSIGCRAVDDGEFALATAAGVELGEGTRGVAVAIRRGTELVRDGDALLIVTGATAEAGVR